MRSRPFDAEGVPTAPRALVADGVLQGWLLDIASASQLGLSSTGHAARGVSSPPSPSATNLYLAAGTLTPAALMEDIVEGVYVTELIGMGVNGLTGDYSRGAAGFMIRHGAHRRADRGNHHRRARCPRCLPSSRRRTICGFRRVHRRADAADRRDDAGRRLVVRT